MHKQLVETLFPMSTEHNETAETGRSYPKKWDQLSINYGSRA